MVLKRKNGTDAPNCKAAIETQTERTNVWTWVAGVGGEWGKDKFRD